MVIRAAHSLSTSGGGGGWITQYADNNMMVVDVACVCVCVVGVSMRVRACACSTQFEVPTIIMHITFQQVHQITMFEKTIDEFFF